MARNGTRTVSNTSVNHEQPASGGRAKLRIISCLPLVLSIVFTGASATNASAACPGSANAGPFYIDGVVGDTLNGPDGWCNNSGVSPGANKVTDPSGNAKELGPANQTNTKVNPINTATTPMLDFTNPNGQVDLNTIYTQSAVHSNQHLWFYFGWARDSNSGSGFIAIELERTGVPNGCIYTDADIDMKLPQLAAETTLINNCNPWSGRSGNGQSDNSDLMLLWDQQGGSKTIYVRYFDKTAGKFGVATPLNAAQAVAEYSLDGFRGEAAVDLTALVNPNGQPACLTFANIIPGTVTGNSDTADYKDTVLAAFPFASSCGSVAIKKVTKNPDESSSDTAGTFRYTLSRANDADIRYSFTAPDPCDGTACAESLKLSTRTLTLGGQTQTHLNLLAATDYRVGEATTNVLESIWSFVSITCAVGSDYPTQLSQTSNNPLTAITVTAGATTYCVIVNQRVKTTPEETTSQGVKVYLFDSIKITGIVKTDLPASSVTFSLHSDDKCATTALGSVNASITYSDNGTRGDATMGSEIQVFSFGGNTYYWNVHYPGDLLNNAFDTCVGADPIGDLESATVTVTHTP
jgi:hypothetical protein